MVANLLPSEKLLFEFCIYFFLLGGSMSSAINTIGNNSKINSLPITPSGQSQEGSETNDTDLFHSTSQKEMNSAPHKPRSLPADVPLNDAPKGLSSETKQQRNSQKADSILRIVANLIFGKKCGSAGCTV